MIMEKVHHLLLIIFCVIFFSTKSYSNSNLLLKPNDLYCNKISNDAYDDHIVVPEDGTLTLSKSSYKITSLILEDNSTLIISNNLKTCLIDAERIKVGRNCLIIAKGRDGANGANGKNAQGYGRQGEAGKKGAPGGDGVDLILSGEFRYFGSLKVISSGGNGGNGGNGGRGSRGRPGQSNPFGGCVRVARPGGSGGNGGNGGLGGLPGRLIIIPKIRKAFENDIYTLTEITDDLISFEANVGDLGLPGQGGIGGFKGKSSGSCANTASNGSNGRLGGYPFPQELKDKNLAPSLLFQENRVNNLAEKNRIYKGLVVNKIEIIEPSSEDYTETHPNDNYELPKWKNWPDSRNSLSGSDRFVALIIYAQDYQDESISDLKWPKQDAEELEKILKSKYLFDRVDIVPNATKQDWDNWIQTFKFHLKKNDNLLVFYSGHGIKGFAGPKENKSKPPTYWQLTDAKNAESSSWLRHSTIQLDLINLNVRNVVLISDSCWSAGLHKSGSRVSNSLKILYSIESDLVATSGADQLVPDKSLYNKKLFDELRNNTKKYVILQDLFFRVKKQVIKETNGTIRPLFGSFPFSEEDGGEFILIRK
jgi:hypothetical protein